MTLHLTGITSEPPPTNLRLLNLTTPHLCELAVWRSDVTAPADMALKLSIRGERMEAGQWLAVADARRFAEGILRQCDAYGPELARDLNDLEIAA